MTFNQAHESLPKPHFAVQPETSPKELVLLVSTDPEARAARTALLERSGYLVRGVNWGEQLFAFFGPDVSVVLVDNTVPSNMQIAALCEQIRSRHAEVPIIVCDVPNGSDTVRDAIAKLTPYCVSRTSSLQLLSVLKQAIAYFRLKKEQRATYRHLGLTPSSVTIPENSPLKKQIEERCRGNDTVLIFGERGTGKTTTAQLIHQAGDRASHPYFMVSCHSVPSLIIEAELFGRTTTDSEYPGRLEICRNGTIFLDNVDHLSHGIQDKVAAFLKTRTYRPLGSDKERKSDVRIIVSMRKPATETLELGLLTHSLYAQLFYKPLQIPPLRRRINELNYICCDFLARMSEQSSVISHRAMAKLERHPWPGNLHELETVLTHAVRNAKNGVINEFDVSLDHAFSWKRRDYVSLGLAGMTMEQVECQLIRETLEHCNDHRAKAAEMLGFSEKTIYNKINKYKF